MNANNKKQTVEEVVNFRKDVLKERYMLMKRLSDIEKVLNNVDNFLEDNCKHERLKDRDCTYDSEWTCIKCGL